MNEGMRVPYALSFQNFIEATAEHFGMSKGELRRLVVQGAVEIAGEKVVSGQTVGLDGSVVKVGKHRFAQLPDVRDNLALGESWEHPNGCPPDCPACAEAREMGGGCCRKCANESA